MVNDSKQPQAAASPRDPADFPAYPGLARARREQIKGWLQNLQITPQSCVEWRCSSAWSLPRRSVSDSMWSYILSGRGSFWIEDPHAVQGFDPGDLILFPRNLEHGVRGSGGEIRMINHHFFAEVHGFVDLLRLSNLRGRLPEEDFPDAPFGRISHDLARLFARRPVAWRTQARALLEELLTYLLQHHPCPSAGSRTVQTGQAFARLLPALACAEEHFQEADLSVADLAREAGLSEVYLRRLFQQALGVSPVRYIQQKRVDHACRLLHSTADTVAAIARVCGFRSKQYFHRVFKAHKNCAPRQYRHAEML